MPPRAPPLSVDDIYEASRGTCISQRDARALIRDDCFLQCQSRNEQIIFFKYFLNNNCYIFAGPKLLSVIFKIKPEHVSKILSKAKKAKKEIGRPLTIDPESEKTIIAEIISKRETFDFMTITQIIKFVENYPINRGNKHVTLVVTISAGGDAYFPMAITSDPSLEKIFDLGIRRDTDLILKVSNS